jgi:hypothetical protein
VYKKNEKQCQITGGNKEEQEAMFNCTDKKEEMRSCVKTGNKMEEIRSCATPGT